MSTEPDVAERTAGLPDVPSDAPPMACSSRSNRDRLLSDLSGLLLVVVLGVGVSCTTESASPTAASESANPTAATVWFDGYCSAFLRWATDQSAVFKRGEAAGTPTSRLELKGQLLDAFIAQRANYDSFIDWLEQAGTPPIPRGEDFVREAHSGFSDVRTDIDKLVDLAGSLSLTDTASGQQTLRDIQALEETIRGKLPGLNPSFRDYASDELGQAVFQSGCVSKLRAAADLFPAQ